MFLSERLSNVTPRKKALILAALLLPGFWLYIWGIDKNPPGFYVDEAAVSYNAYTIYKNGTGEFGHSFPLYFPVFPLGPPFEYLGYVEPTQIYALAALYHVFPPSVTLSRGLSAAAIFLTALLLGLLAFRISGHWMVGIIIALTGLSTPWLFEMSRLAFGASLYPLTTALLLTALYRASLKDRWTPVDIGLIVASLALTTYTYAIGRLLGPLFALGIILIVTNRRQFKGLILTWVGYAITLIPMAVVYFRKPEALMGRLTMSVGYFTEEKTYWQIFLEFLGHYAANISPNRLLFIGDLNERHHIPGTAPIFAITLFLALVGVVAILVKYRREAFWRFVIFGLVVSVIPASFTKDDFHMLRLSAFPVFLITLTIAAYAWFVSSDAAQTSRRRKLGYVAVTAIAVLTLVQAVLFQIKFNEHGPTRLGYFDSNFPAAFAAALERPERPIYLVDQSYYHTYWQAITQGVDLSNFHQMEPRKKPPANSLVLSSEERCSDCEMFYKDIPYVVYRANSGTEPQPVQTGELRLPRGISSDVAGSYYIADTGNSRILKFDASGNHIATFGVPGEGVGQIKEPHGIAVDGSGMIYVTDSGNHKLVRFKPDGSYDREWRGPDSGFYGPRDIAIGAKKDIYVVDQGRTRIVKFRPSSDQFEVWGVAGSEAGMLNDPSGVTVDDEIVLVTDTGNGRIQIFDLDGKFVRQFAVPQWKAGEVSYPDVEIDRLTDVIYVTNPGTSELLTFTLEGRFIESVRPASPYALKIPSALNLLTTPTHRRLYVLNSGSTSFDQQSALSVFELGKTKPGQAPSR